MRHYYACWTTRNGQHLWQEARSEQDALSQLAMITDARANGSGFAAWRDIRPPAHAEHTAGGPAECGRCQDWMDVPAQLAARVALVIDDMGNDAPLALKQLWGYLQPGDVLAGCERCRAADRSERRDSRPVSEGGTASRPQIPAGDLPEEQS
jgi:hypothetical protein